MKHHPIVVLLAVAWLTVEAAATLARTVLVPALALLLALLNNDVKQTGEQRHCPAPAVHPLAALAEQLTSDLSRRQLQQLTGIRANHGKAALAALAVAC